MSRSTGPLRSPLVSGVVYLAVIGVLAGALLLKGAGTFEENFDVTTEVPTIGSGLPVGADVKLRGLTVGRVSKVDARRDGALVAMELEPEAAEHVPHSVESRVLTANLFGVPYVELVPKGPETPSLRENSRIKADTSAEAVELAQLFETAYDVMIAIEPAKLNSALTAISSTVHGNGDRIGALIEQSASYLSALTRHSDRFERNLVLLERIVTRSDASAPALLEAIDNTAALARLVVANRQELANLLAVGRRSLDTAGGILEAMEPRLIAVARVSAPVFETLAANNGSPRASLLALGQVAQNFVESWKAHGGLNVKTLVTAIPLPAYRAVDCPRYGSLAGPNCGQARTSSSRYAGTSGTVGTPEELATLRALGDADPDARGLVGLVAGPALRGQVVMTP